MKTSLCGAVLVAIAMTACGGDDALPAPKEATKPVMTATAEPVAPPAPAAPKDIPATSSNPEAVKAYWASIDLLENSRNPEAREAMKKVVALDPTFTSAKVVLGSMTSGGAGDAMIADALAKASGLPEAEMVNLQRVQAQHAREAAKAVDLAKKVTELVPASAHAQAYYGSALANVNKVDASKAAYKKAIELDPTYAFPLNMLAYAELASGEPDAGIAHLQKYASLRPKEPNPADSLGEAYLTVGKLDESEAAFKKALEIDPTFTVAGDGIGFAQLYRGDAKGIDQLVKYRDSAGMTAADRSDEYSSIAWSQLGLGKSADAMKTLDAWDADMKKATDAPEQGLFASLDRMTITIEAGKPDEALKQMAPLLDRITKSSVSESRKARFQILANSTATIAYARLKKAPEAEKAKAAVDSLAANNADTNIQTMVAVAHGEALLAKGDAAGAAKEFAACAAVADYCTWEKMKAQTQAKMTTEAAASKDAITKNHQRHGMSFFVWTKIAPPAAPAKK